jgi:hypothetical protein
MAHQGKNKLQRKTVLLTILWVLSPLLLVGILWHFRSAPKPAIRVDYNTTTHAFILTIENQGSNYLFPELTSSDFASFEKTCFGWALCSNHHILAKGGSRFPKPISDIQLKMPSDSKWLPDIAPGHKLEIQLRDHYPALWNIHQIQHSDSFIWECRFKDNFSSRWMSNRGAILLPKP